MTMLATHALKRLVDSRPFNYGIVGCIVTTSVCLGLETYPAIAQRWDGLLSLIDKTILGIFVVEQLARLLAEGKRPWRYFADPWNLFDFMIIAVCLLPLHQPSVAVVRLVRILRVLRLFKTLPRLRMLVNGMIKSLKSIGYIAILLSAHFYVFAVLGVTLFRHADPGHFADLQTTMLTLFTVLTLETWPDIMAPTKAVFPSGAPFFFVSFIIVGTMIILNLLVGVVVGSMADATREADRELQERVGGKMPGQASASTRAAALEASIENIERGIGLAEGAGTQRPRRRMSARHVGSGAQKGRRPADSNSAPNAILSIVGLLYVDSSRVTEAAL